jgi:hypothetical protein
LGSTALQFEKGLSMFKKKDSPEPQIILPDGVREKIEAKKRRDALSSALKDLFENLFVTVTVAVVISGLEYLLSNRFSEIPTQVITLVLTIVSIVLVLALITFAFVFYRRRRIQSDKFAIDKLKVTHQEIFSEIRENTLSLLER